MNEYSFLLKDSKGVYTIQDKMLKSIDYDGHYDNYNYGFFNISEVLFPKVFGTLEDVFVVLICERVKDSTPILNDTSTKEVDCSKSRFGIQLPSGDFILPNGNLLSSGCDLTLLPEDVTEYSKTLLSKELTPVEVKRSGKYIFYTVTVDKNEWKVLSRIEVIE